MSTTLAEIKDRNGLVLEIYDSSAGLVLLMSYNDGSPGMKFFVEPGEMAETIITAFRISRNASLGIGFR